MSERRRRKAIEIGTMTDLLNAFRIRKAELGLNMTKIDALAGFQFGYAGKLFSRNDSRAHRAMTDFSLAGLLQALECKLVLVPNDDEQAHKRVQEIVKAMRAAATQQLQVDEVAIEKGAEAMENHIARMENLGAAGGRAKWKRYGKKSRSAMMKDLAEKRWSEKRAAILKARRQAVARKGARARWKKAKARKGRAPSTMQLSLEMPRMPEPT